jgi:putative ABC transport system permease protein
MDIGQDLRYAARTLTRSRAFSLTVILVTALGVGANTAAFSVADFVLFRPLPFPDPDSLVRICEGPRTGGGWGCMNQISPANYRDFEEMSTSFAAMGAYANDAANLVGGSPSTGLGTSEPRRLAIARADVDVLPLLGVAPALGRVFEKSDIGSNVAVLGYGLWQSQFGGNPSVLGQKISLNGDPYTVVGVMPRTFYFPTRETQLWTLLAFREELFANRANNFTEGIARLKPGVAFEQAKAQLEMIAERLATTYPDTNEETGVSVFLMRDNMSPRSRLMLISLSGASLALLLLTCANLASLLIARAAANERELAVRAALGAGRQRLIRQQVVQSLLLTAIGGALGVLLAVAIVPLFSTLVPPTLPVATQPALDLRVMGMAALFTLLTALGFGLFPALRAGRTGFDALRDGARTGGGAKQRLRATLVMIEVAVSVLLLISSGLLIRAVWRVQGVDPGFKAEHVLTLRTALPRPKYDDPVRRTQFYDRVLESVRALPGVESAGFISGLPLVVTGLITGVEVPGQNMRNYRVNGVSHRWITPGYFKTMGIPLHRGRDVEDADAITRPWVAVVSQSFVNRYWPDQDGIGKQFRHRNQLRTIVGIVGEVRVRGLERSSEPQMYLPAQQADEQNPANFDPKDLVIRHSGPGDPLVAAIREIVRSADPEQPISDVRPLEAVLAGDTATRRAQLQVLGVLAVVAVLLSGVGIYGLLAYMVSQRAREIGVRLALGAEPAQVGRMIFSDGMRLALFGIVPGVLGAYGVGRWMSTLLFGVSPADPATFATAIGVAIVITFAGSVVPALRAVRVTPMSVLKVD